MKVLTCSVLSEIEKLEIAKFRGIEVFAYSKSWEGMKRIYTKVHDTENEHIDILFIKDYGDKFKDYNYEDRYKVDFDNLRFRTFFIEHVEKNQDVFNNIYIDEIEEGQKFLIMYDHEMGAERLECIEKGDIYTVINGSVRRGI